VKVLIETEVTGLDEKRIKVLKLEEVRRNREIRKI
jgi:hypothetical protein